MTTTSTSIEPVTLTGEGYKLSISPEAERLRGELIEAATTITAVTTPEESELAQYEVRRLAAFRIEVERSRKLVKEPVIELGKKIDQAAKGFINDVTAAESRLRRLVGDHAEAVAAEKRRLEAEERAKFEAAKAAKEAAERAEREAEEARAKAAAGGQSIAEKIESERKARELEAELKQAEEERRKANAERMSQSAAVAATNVSRGVRFVLDFEVEDVVKLYHEKPELVKLEAKRSAVLAWLKVVDAEGEIDVEDLGRVCGLKVTRKPVTSTR